jgi:hypothetical protein
MSIQQKMQDTKVEMEIRREMEQAIEQFCRNIKLKADEREKTIQFIASELDDRDNLARTLAWKSPATVLADADTRNMVVEYLTQFSQEMDELAAALNALSKEAKDELAMLYAGE